MLRIIIHLFHKRALNTKIIHIMCFFQILIINNILIGIDFFFLCAEKIFESEIYSYIRNLRIINEVHVDEFFHQIHPLNCCLQI